MLLPIRNLLFNVFFLNVLPFFNLFDPIGLKLLTRLGTDLSHLRDHKFRHNFNDTVNPICSCNIEAESTKHYLLHWLFYIDLRKTLLGIIDIIGFDYKPLMIT